MISLKLFFLRLYKGILIIFNLRLLKVFLKHQVMAGVEHNVVLRKENFKTIIDIGANRGQFSLAASSINKEATIYAFEPLKKPAEVFKKIFCNYENINLYNTAIGSSNKTSIIHISNKDDSSSLLEISEVQLKYHPNTNEVGTQKVNVSKLNTYIQAPDISSPALLKIDVQGFELEALMGAEDLLDKFEYIYCECSYLALYKDQPLVNDIIIFLSKNDFILSGIYNSQIERGNYIQSDFLFKKNKL